MTQTSEYREKLKKKIFLGILTANPPNLVKKNTNTINYKFLFITISSHKNQ